MIFLERNLPRILLRLALAWLCVLAWGNPFLHGPSEAVEPQPAQPAVQPPAKPHLQHPSAPLRGRRAPADHPKAA